MTHTFQKTAIAALIGLNLWSCAPKETEPRKSEPAPVAAAKLPVIPEVRQELAGLLTTIETVPPRQAFAKHGASGFAALLDIYRDENELPTVRSRAVSAMPWTDVALAREELKRIAVDPKALATCRRSAVYALGSMDGVAALPALLPTLDDADPEIRETSVRVLGKLKDEKANAALRERLKVETSPAVLETLGRVLGAK